MASNSVSQPLPRPEPCEGLSPLPLDRPPGNDYPLELFSLLESIPAMKKHGYVMEPLTDTEINENLNAVFGFPGIVFPSFYLLPSTFFFSMTLFGRSRVRSLFFRESHGTKDTCIDLQARMDLK